MINDMGSSQQMEYCTLCSRHVFISNLVMHVVEIDYRTHGQITHTRVCLQCCKYIEERNRIYEQIAAFLTYYPEKYLHLLREHALQETVI